MFTNQICCLFLISCLSFPTYLRAAIGLLYPKHQFDHSSELGNIMCPPQDVVSTLTLDSGIHCAGMCTRTSTCRTFMYNRDLKECVLCRERHSPEGGFTTSLGYGYYSDQTRNYHLGCTNNAQCNEPSNICMSSKCVCNHGYSYEPGTMTCRAGCSTYGNTYEFYPQYYMVSLNNEARDGVSLQWCKDYCASVSAFTCRSFEREYSKCYFSSANALTHPSEYRIWTAYTSDYYNRNCA